MADKIGVAGLPGLVATLEREGLEVVTGTDFRDAARNIRQAHSTSDGGFPVLVGDIDGGDPSLAAWVRMTARNVAVTIIRLRAASGVTVDDVTEHQAPVGLGDVLISLDLPFPSDAAFTTTIQPDGAAVSENGQQQPDSELDVPDTPPVVEHTPPPTSSRDSDPWAKDQASAPPTTPPQPVPAPQPDDAVVPPPTPSRTSDPWLEQEATTVPIPDPEEVEPAEPVAQQEDFSPEPAPQPEPVTSATEPQAEQGNIHDEVEDFDFDEPGPAPAPQPVTETTRGTIPGTPVAQRQPAPQPEGGTEPSPDPEPEAQYDPAPSQDIELPVAPTRNEVDEIDDMFAEAAPTRVRSRASLRASHQGATIVSFAGKGGVGKTTVAITLAQYAAMHGPEGYKVILVDGNRGQGDVRTNLRIPTAPIPNIYNAVAGNPADAVAIPEVIAKYRDKMWEPIEFGLVAAPPPDLADPSVVTASVYRDVIEYAQSVADLVVIDTQIVEAYDTSKLFDRVFVPLLADDAWGIGLTDISAGPRNLIERIQSFEKEGVTRDRLMFGFNRVDPDTDTVESLETPTKRMGQFGTHVGTLWHTPKIASSMRLGNPPVDDDGLARMLSQVLYRVTGLADFDPARLAPEEEEPTGFFARFMRRRKQGKR